jgi:VanZ family protein
VDSETSSLKRGWLWPLVIALLIFSATTRSTVAGPHVQHFDKVAHFFVYGLLATLVCRQGRGWRAAGWSLLAVSVFGATDEWHQYYVPGRSCELGDWIADTTGAALAISLYVGWQRYRRLLEHPIGPPLRRVENSGAAARIGMP